jgi:hypothetical protein
MKIIHTRRELVALAAELGVRPDWHEPDEQLLTAEVKGDDFDNAGFWPEGHHGRQIPQEILETHVILSQDGEPVAAVNLANLFAWAAEHRS